MKTLKPCPFCGGEGDRMNEYIVETLGEWGEYRDGKFVLEDEYMAVPAVPLVRCSHCKYYELDGEPSEVYSDRFWCDCITNYMPTDGYCNWGERRG